VKKDLCDTIEESACWEDTAEKFLVFIADVGGQTGEKDLTLFSVEMGIWVWENLID
jgi:hypothetical protein